MGKPASAGARRTSLPSLFFPVTKIRGGSPAGRVFSAPSSIPSSLRRVSCRSSLSSFCSLSVRGACPTSASVAARCRSGTQSSAIFGCSLLFCFICIQYSRRRVQNHYNNQYSPWFSKLFLQCLCATWAPERNIRITGTSHSGRSDCIKRKTPPRRTADHEKMNVECS